MTLRWYSLTFPRDLGVDAVTHFTRLLAARARRGLFRIADPVVLEVSVTNGVLSWRLGVTKRDHDQVVSALHQAAPLIRLEPVSYRVVTAPTWELRVSSPRRPLRTDVSEQASAAVLNATQHAGRHETICLHFLIGSWLPRHAVPPSTVAQRSHRSILDAGRLVLDSEQTKALRDKQAEPLFGVVVRLAIQAGNRQRRRVLRQRVIGALQHVRSPGVGFERRLLPSWWVRHRLQRLQFPMVAWPCVLNAAELATCLGWPINGPSLHGVSYISHRLLPAAKGLLRPESDDHQLRVTGRSTYPGQSGVLVQSIEAARLHTHIVGPTGVGKSTLLARMVLSDIAAGRGVVVIDFKRDLVDAIADRIPEHRLNDVVLLDPAETCPVGFNVLNTTQPDVAVDMVLHILQELYAANWGPRTADVLHNALVTLIRSGGMTLCELVPLLTQPDFRRRLVEAQRHDVLGVAPFWAQFHAMSISEQATVTAPALNKLRPFTGRAAVRGVIGQSAGFDLMNIFTKQQVLLASLAKGDIGSEGAQLLGALLVGGLWSTIQRRSQVPPERRAPVVVYLDEFADVLRLPLDLGDALAQARGLGVGLVLAHQEMRAQLSPAMRAGVLANCRSRIVYQCGNDDATALAKVLGGDLTAQDLHALPAFETYQTLALDGRTTSPASAATLPLGPSLGTLATIRRLSSERHGASREATDDELRARRMVSNSAPSSIGSRPKRRPLS